MVIQDQNYLYLTTHICLMLKDEIVTNVKSMEINYADDVDEFWTQTPRGRMKWKSYKEVIFEILLMDKGKFDLCNLIQLYRENSETAEN